MTDTATYTAHLTGTEDRQVQLLVTRDIPAGICGPWITATFSPGSLLLTHVERYLADYELAPAESWTAGVGFDGLQLTAKLGRIPQRTR